MLCCTSFYERHLLPITIYLLLLVVIILRYKVGGKDVKLMRNGLAVLLKCWLCIHVKSCCTNLCYWFMKLNLIFVRFRFTCIWARCESGAWHTNPLKSDYARIWICKHREPCRIMDPNPVNFMCLVGLNIFTILLFSWLIPNLNYFKMRFCFLDHCLFHFWFL